MLLLSWISNKWLSKSKFISISAIAHLVAHGVAHRDVKSDNILVELPGTNEDCFSEPRIALTDFGCCLIPADCITPLRLSFTSGQVSR